MGDMDQEHSKNELLSAIIGSLFLGVFSNTKVRRFVKHCFYGDVARGELEKFFDFFFELLHGFADGRGLILSSETIYNQYHDTQQGTKALSAQVVLYTTASCWALFSGVIGYQFEPNVSLADLLSDKVLSSLLRKSVILFNGLFATITFSLLMGSNIRSTESPFKEIFATAFSLLFLASFLRALYFNRQDNHHLINQQEALLEANEVDKSSEAEVINIDQAESAIPSASSERAISALNTPLLTHDPATEVKTELPRPN